MQRDLPRRSSSVQEQRQDSASDRRRDRPQASPHSCRASTSCRRSTARCASSFVPVTTGITGATDIEVLSGLKDGDEIVTGRYKVLRTLKSGTAVKRDNSVQTTTDDSSS